MPQDLVAWWTSPQWRAEAESWMLSSLAELGHAVTGPIEQPRVRFWSTQLCAPTDRGRVWFKENSPSQAFEAVLIQTLAELRPEQVVPPLALDRERGWLLTADAGPTLRDTGAVTPDSWERILTEFGALQRGIESAADRILGLGLTAMPAGTAGRYAQARLSALASLPVSDPRHIGAAAAERAGAGIAQVAYGAELLGTIPVRDSLQHNDLHDNNAFAPGVGPLRFFDLGDAVWAHPFATLDIAILSMTDTWSCPDDDPRVTRAVDAYLANWVDLASISQLQALVPAARRLAGLHRHESWRRLTAAVPKPAVPAEWRSIERDTLLDALGVSESGAR